MKTQKLKMTLNGQPVEIQIRPHRRLLDVLREELGLTGTKDGCSEGECGACTVILNGRPILSCLTPALKANGAVVETIEGLGSDGQLHPLQQAFVAEGAIQCGYCTPGLIMTAKALLDRNPHPSREEISIALSGNLCRCTGYMQIIEAVEKVAIGKTESEDTA
ncbi:MAG: (2Fe-2S)-binding protein [Anaerolineae bacterium]